VTWNELLSFAESWPGNIGLLAAKLWLTTFCRVFAESHSWSSSHSHCVLIALGTWPTSRSRSRKKP
jgi:hypothetical protein